jgi:MFS family permease
MVLGQTVLGQLSDRYGRKPLIVIGVLLNATLYFGMAVVDSVAVMTAIAFLSGMGSALMAPALSAYILDISIAKVRSFVMGIKEAALALGSAIGPLLVVVASRFMTPKWIFLSAGIYTLLIAGLGLVLLKGGRPSREEAQEIAQFSAWNVSQRRNLAAQASLSSLVSSAYNARGAPVRLRTYDGEGLHPDVDLDGSSTLLGFMESHGDSNVE